MFSFTTVGCRYPAVVIVCALAPLAARAQDARLTLDAALQAAVVHSSAIQAAQSSVGASAEAAVKAGQLPDPMLKAGVDNLPINGPQGYTIGQDFMTMRRIGIEQEWVSGDKRRLRTGLADRMVDRQRSSRLEQIAKVREQTAKAWLDAIYARKSLSLAEELSAHMTHELGAAQASYRGARGTAAAVPQTLGMLAQANDRVLQAKQSLKSALIALSRWTSVPVDDVAGEPPALDSAVASLSVDALKQVQPALAAASAEIELADAQTAVASSDRNPNWSWELSYQRRGGHFSDMVSVGVSIPLPINRKNRQDRDVAEKAELGTQARLSFEDVQRQVRADIQNLAATVASGRARIANLNETLLPSADERVRLALAGYRANTASLADVFDARRARLEAQLQVVDLQRETALSWAKLEYQIVPQSLAATY